LTRDDKINGVSTVVTCNNDGEAIQKARRLMNGFDIEVWNGFPRCLQT